MKCFGIQIQRVGGRRERESVGKRRGVCVCARAQAGRLQTYSDRGMSNSDLQHADQTASFTSCTTEEDMSREKEREIVCACRRERESGRYGGGGKRRKRGFVEGDKEHERGREGWCVCVCVVQIMCVCVG